MKKNWGFKVGLWAVLVAPLVANAQNDSPTGFSNTGTIINTRHNLTQSSLYAGTPDASNPPGGGASTMNFTRNNYGEVCVYCHTPHAAEGSGKAPLWNRLLPAASSYTTYTTLNSSTMTQTVNAPGGGSLPCLSCHDGTQAVDAILNMPGSGNYSSTATQTFNTTGLTSSGIWQYSKSSQHKSLGPGGGSCMACHNPDGGTGMPGDPTDFTVFVIGKDLRNDHPVGVTFPTTTGGTTDWKTPGGTKTSGSFTTKFFDENGNGRMDKGDIRLIDSGNGASVECSSCHDPHGVPGTGGTFNPTFLRKTNSASAVCLTCHAK